MRERTFGTVLFNIERLALLGSVLAIASLAAGCGAPADAQPSSARPPAAPVSVAPAVQRAVTDSEEFSGRLEAAEFVELRPRIAGVIERIHFEDGALVSKGQLLFSIDPRPFEAEVARAESQRVAAVARAELAASELARAQTAGVARRVAPGVRPAERGVAHQ
jgi:multidrug efflux pump subunit AcrA (membrane-fusion protein)